MKYRLIVLEDNDIIRSALGQFFESLGYEVYSFQDPSLCPLYGKQFCDCPLEHACSDVILSDINMLQVKGIDFVKDMRQKGCKVKNIAVMSGDWTTEAIEQAGKFDIKIFEKPFDLEALKDWLNKCEIGIDEDRKLSNWADSG